MAADLLVALGLVDPGADRFARARALAVARAPVPPGLRAVHSTWIEAGLAALPDRARAAVAAAPANPIDVWLARSATAHLPPMIIEAALARHVESHPAWLLVDGIPTAPVAALLSWLDGIGAEQLAFATTGTSRRFVATSRRAAIARCTGVALDELAHLRIAARTLAPHLSPLAMLQLAVRLPRPVGMVVHRELLDAGAAVEVPAWPALLA